MDDAIFMDVIDSLCKLIKDPPDTILFNPFPITPIPANEVVKSAAFTVLHGDVDCEISFVDFEIEVSEYVDIVHPDEGVDFVDDAFLLLRGDRGKRYLLQHYCLVGGLVLTTEES